MGSNYYGPSWHFLINVQPGGSYPSVARKGRESMSNKITLSCIKADIGGFVGHSAIHPDLETKANECLTKAKADGMLVDFHVTHCGDDLNLIITHTKGPDDEGIHKLAWDTFTACTEVAKKLHLYGAGQDLLADAFSGNVKGAKDTGVGSRR